MGSLICNDLCACCAYEGRRATYESLQVLTQKKCKTTLGPFFHTQIPPYENEYPLQSTVYYMTTSGNGV